MRIGTLVACLAPTLLLSPAVMASDYVPDAATVTEEAKKEKEDGWKGNLSLGASLAFGANDKVVGQLDGSSWTLGLNVNGGINLRRGKHDWRNSLSIVEQVSRSPAINSWIKSADSLDFESIYYFRALEWLGPFARFKLQAPIFKGKDVRAASTDYVLNGVTIAEDANSLKLTDPFQVLTLKQAVGVFAQPIRKDEFLLDLRAGFGVHEIFADGARVVTDDATTADQIELTELDSYVQAGAELAAAVSGVLSEGKVNYKLSGEVMIPVINDDAQNRSAGELTNIEMGARISFKLVEWASLDIEAKAVRQPQVVDEWQKSIGMLLTFGYTVFE